MDPYRDRRNRGRRHHRPRPEEPRRHRLLRTARGRPEVEAGDPVGTIESVKAASEIFCPVSGEVVQVNEEVTDEPDLVNSEPYEAWLFKIRTDGKASSNGLLDSKAYEKLVSGE